MKKKAQRISFIMMIVFFLTGIAMTIVAAVTVGSGFGSLPSYYDGPNPFAKYVFPVILGGLVVTCSITAVWWAVLEHFANVEKELDRIRCRNNTEEALPDSEYSYLPAFIENAVKQPNIPKLAPTAYQPYPHPTYQPVPQEQSAQAVQVVQPVPQEQPTPPAQPVIQEQPAMQEQPVLQEQPFLREQPIPEEPPVLQEQPVLEEQPVLREQPALEPDGWFCSNCGSPNKADSIYCSVCGSKKD